MGGGGADRSACASGQCARAASKILNEISKYIDCNFRSTVTVAYIYIDIEKMSRWSHKCGARSRSPNKETTSLYLIEISRCLSGCALSMQLCWDCAVTYDSVKVPSYFTDGTRDCPRCYGSERYLQYTTDYSMSALEQLWWIWNNTVTWCTNSKALIWLQLQLPYCPIVTPPSFLRPTSRKRGGRA